MRARSLAPIRSTLCERAVTECGLNLCPHDVRRILRSGFVQRGHLSILTSAPLNSAPEHRAATDKTDELTPTCPLFVDLDD